MCEINEIRKQFANGNWKLFLKSVKLTNLRGWTGQKVVFRFPVCAIVGENGIGKSSFLKAAACAYTNKSGPTYYPSSFFMKTQWDDSAIDRACIEYELDHGECPTHDFKWKKTQDWGFSPKGKRPERHVYFLDISRTLPLDATAGYAKIAKLSSKETSHISLSKDYVKAISTVLGKSYSAGRFSHTDTSSSREVGILTRDGRDISQFHQGAGEDTTLDLFKILQKIPDGSLLIIDEIEASLHPQAQRRLIRYLMYIARVKKIQVVLSTHSPFVLDEIPEEGRILLLQYSDTKDILYNISTNFALSTTDEINHPDLFVFVEDEEAMRMINQFINEDAKSDEIRPRISIRYIGDYNIVNTMGKLGKHGKLPFLNIAIVDGDLKENCPDSLYLPGQLPPEKVVFTELQARNWENLDSRFGIGAGTLFKILDDAMLVDDHHKWTTYVGDKIRKSRDTVWEILVEEWSRICCSQEAKTPIINAIKEKLGII